MNRAFIIVIAVLCMTVRLGWAQIPQAIDYQGILTDDTGTAVPDGNYSITFSLYTTESGGSALWSETHPSVAVSKGIFNVILGSTTSEGLKAVPFDERYWLGVRVGAEAELSPRMELTSAAYSLNARSVEDGAITGVKIASNAVTSAKIAAGQVVKSINTLKDAVTLAAGTNVTITPAGNTLTISAASGEGWSLTGNAGTTPGTHFVGTTDNNALELRVNGTRVLRLEPDATSPKMIGGYSGNSLTAGVIGATIAGGGKSADINHVTDYYGTIGGGAGNQAGDDNAEINDAYYNTVAGGHRNVASGQYAAIGGGQSNTASALYATIGGGGGNDVTGGSGTIAGGQNNNAAGFAAVGGGSGNQANYTHTTVAGGEQNKANATYTAIGGGRYNEASGTSSTIGGGRYNTASAAYATIGGGGTSNPSNTATANRVTDDYGTVSGGGNNQAGNGDIDASNRTYATVGGGLDNVAGGAYTTVGGGWNNSASGSYASIPGGLDNTASGSYSFAAGRRAKATYTGCFVWGDSNDDDITTSGPNRFMVRSSGGVFFYTNSTRTTGVRLEPGGSEWISIPAPSDRALKHNIRSVDGREILDRLAQIPVSRWSYQAEDPRIEHMGPMAQDFHAAFGLGEDDRHISSVDANGVALAAIQALNALVKEKDAKIAELEFRLAALEATVAGQARER